MNYKNRIKKIYLYLLHFKNIYLTLITREILLNNVYVNTSIFYSLFPLNYFLKQLLIKNQFNEISSIHKFTLPFIINDNNLLFSSQPGTGKSLFLLIPILNNSLNYIQFHYKPCTYVFIFHSIYLSNPIFYLLHLFIDNIPNTLFRIHTKINTSEDNNFINLFFLSKKSITFDDKIDRYLYSNSIKKIYIDNIESYYLYNKSTLCTLFSLSFQFYLSIVIIFSTNSVLKRNLSFISKLKRYYRILLTKSTNKYIDNLHYYFININQLSIFYLHTILNTINRKKTIITTQLSEKVLFLKEYFIKYFRYYKLVIVHSHMPYKNRLINLKLFNSNPISVLLSDKSSFEDTYIIYYNWRIIDFDWYHSNAFYIENLKNSGPYSNNKIIHLIKNPFLSNLLKRKENENYSFKVITCIHSNTKIYNNFFISLLKNNYRLYNLFKKYLMKLTKLLLRNIDTLILKSLINKLTIIYI